MEVTSVIERSNVRETAGAVYINNVVLEPEGKVDLVLIKKACPIWKNIVNANDGETFIAKGRLDNGERGPKFIVSTIYLGHQNTGIETTSKEVENVSSFDIANRLEVIYNNLSAGDKAKSMIGDLLFEMGHSNHLVPSSF